MEYQKPLDIEDVLRVKVQEHTEAKCLCLPLPNPLPVPSVVFKRVGGSRRDKVLDTYNVNVDCRAESMCKAVDLANEIAGICTELDFPIYECQINAQPYPNFDTFHKNVERVSMTLFVTARNATSQA